LGRAVYLHVGTAKSGTTYLQRAVAQNRLILSEAGLLYPGDDFSHFLAAVDLAGEGFKGYTYPEAEGAWQRVVDEAMAFSGDVLISHETLGAISPDPIRRAVDSFPGREVRVLVTCRDLGRQIPAYWQERVKNRYARTYSHYLKELFGSWNGGEASPNVIFWRSQNVIALVRRWSEAVGAANVRLVTVPPPGAAKDELWRRFRLAAELPEVEYDLEVASNPSLGTAETELLRRLNPLFPELTWPQYQNRVKSRLVTQELAEGRAHGKLSVPRSYRSSTAEMADQIIEFLRGSGCTVFGDLEDLRPSFGPETVMPEELSNEQLLDVSLRVLAAVAARGQLPPVMHHPSGREAARLAVTKAWQRLRRVPRDEGT
jgi:hypothetical protein